jgi:hypothetical protein
MPVNPKIVHVLCLSCLLIVPSTKGHFATIDVSTNYRNLKHTGASLVLYFFQAKVLRNQLSRDNY